MMDKYYFFQSYYFALKGLKQQQRYELREAMDEFMFEGKEHEFKDSISKTVWMLLLPTLSKSKRNWENAKTKNDAKAEAKEKLAQSETLAKTEQNFSETVAKVNFRPSISISKEKGERKKEINIITPISPKGESAAFEKFWKAYPRHEMKQRAIKAFPNALKKTDIDTILKAIERQMHSEKWTKDNGQFIPHPATWLNGGCWEDEVKVSLETEKPKAVIPHITECPKCGSHDIRQSLERFICNSCGVMRDWNAKTGKWEEC